ARDLPSAVGGRSSRAQPSGKLVGAGLALVGSTVAAASNVYCEWLVKLHPEDSLHFQNMQLYAFGIALNAATLALKAAMEPDSPLHGRRGFFTGYNVWVWLIIVLGVISGITVSFALKFVDNSIFTEKQRAVFDMVLPISYEEAQGHESWSSPPPDPEMPEAWRKTRSQHLARLRQLCSTLERAEEELASLQARIAAQLDEEAKGTRVVRIYKVLIRETKETAKLKAQLMEMEQSHEVRLRSCLQAIAQKTLHAAPEQLERQRWAHQREMGDVGSAARRELEHEQAAYRMWPSGNQQHRQDEAGAALRQMQRRLAMQAQAELQEQRGSSDQDARALVDAANRARQGEGERLQMARRVRERCHQTQAELEGKALALAQQARASEAKRAAELGQHEVQAGQDMILELQARQAVMETHHAQQERRLVEFGMGQAEAHQQGKRRIEEEARQAREDQRQHMAAVGQTELEEHRASRRHLEQQVERAQRDAYQHLQRRRSSTAPETRALASSALTVETLELDIPDEMAAKLAGDDAVMGCDQALAAQEEDHQREEFEHNLMTIPYPHCGVRAPAQRRSGLRVRACYVLLLREVAHFVEAFDDARQRLQPVGGASNVTVRKMTQQAKLTNQWRGPVLRRQFHEHKVRVAGVQEARNDRRSATNNGDFIVSSHHDSYNVGNEIWLNTSIPLGENSNGPLFFRPRHLRDIVSEPRLLLVRTETKAITFRACVARATHSKKSDIERQQFWQRPISITAQHKPSIIFLDANGRLGSTQSDWADDVAFVQNEDANIHGPPMQRSTSTRASRPSCPAAIVITLGRRSATTSRIDYFLADHDRANHFNDSSAIEGIETMENGCQEGLGREDHAPLRARARWKMRYAVPLQLFSNYGQASVRQQDGSGSMHCSAGSYVDQIGRYYNDHIYHYMITAMEAAISAFARQDKKRYQGYISDHAVNIIVDSMLHRVMHDTYMETYRLRCPTVLAIEHDQFERFLEASKSWVSATKKVIPKLANKDFDPYLELQGGDEQLGYQRSIALAGAIMKHHCRYVSAYGRTSFQRPRLTTNAKKRYLVACGPPKLLCNAGAWITSTAGDSSMIAGIADEQQTIREITEAVMGNTYRRGKGIMAHARCDGDKARQESDQIASSIHNKQISNVNNDDIQAGQRGQRAPWGARKAMPNAKPYIMVINEFFRPAVYIGYLCMAHGIQCCTRENRDELNMAEHLGSRADCRSQQGGQHGYFKYDGASDHNCNQRGKGLGGGSDSQRDQGLPDDSDDVKAGSHAVEDEEGKEAPLAPMGGARGWPAKKRSNRPKRGRRGL
ncbi:unnamed protein product, partial [Prorocentrum cordatum]